MFSPLLDRVSSCELRCPRRTRPPISGCPPWRTDSFFSGSRHWQNSGLCVRGSLIL